MPNIVNPNQPTNQIVQTEPEKVLLKWEAPARPFKRRDREFYVTLIAISGIVGLVLFLAEGFMPVILLVSIIFLFYILSTVEPNTIPYSVTTFGVKIVDKRSDWNYLRRFWFSKRFDSDLLIIETTVIPGRIELVINGSDKPKLKKLLSDYLVEEEIPPSAIDKAANWLASKLPNKK